MTSSSLGSGENQRHYRRQHKRRGPHHKGAFRKKEPRTVVKKQLKVQAPYSFVKDFVKNYSSWLSQRPKRRKKKQTITMAKAIAHIVHIQSEKNIVNLADELRLCVSKEIQKKQSEKIIE